MEIGGCFALALGDLVACAGEGVDVSDGTRDTAYFLELVGVGLVRLPSLGCGSCFGC